MANKKGVSEKKDTNPHIRSGLFKKITNRLLFVGLAPLVALALISVLLSWLSYRNSNMVFERTLLEQKRAEVQREVQRRVEILEIFVQYDDALPISDVGQLFIIEGLLDSDPHLQEVAIIQTLDVGRTPVGVESERCVRVEEGIDCTAPLRNRIEDLPFQVSKGGDSYIGPVLWNDGKPSVVIASDVRNKSKTDSIGVVVGILDLSSLQLIFDEAGFGEVGSVYLTDINGLVMAHSGGTQFHERSAKGALLDIAESGARVLPAAFSDRMSFTSGIPIRIENQTWFLVAEWPLLVMDWPPSGAFVDVVFLALQFFMVGLLLLLVVRLIAIRFSRSIVTPIRTVQLGAERIGRGDFSQRIVVNTDDELEELGESINSMSEDLMKLEKVRTAETRARALATAVAKEESLKEEKDVLIATASHQFRTPVTALNWNIDLLRKMSLPDDAKGLLDGVAEHTKNLATIASDLLNSTAFGAGYRVVPDAKPVNIMQTLDEVIERYAKDAAQKPVTFTRQYPDKRVLVRGSFAAIRIAFEQLVSNAIRYSKQSGVVTVTIRQTEDGRAGIDIADTGIGIPEDEQQFLFDAFFRAKNSIVMKNVGTGLGLYVANNIVTGHGGLIEFSSEENKGTTFTVTLPGMGASIGISPPAPSENPLEDGALDDSPK